MTDLRQRLSELDRVDAPDMRASINRRISGLRLEAPETLVRASRQGWHGPLIAIGAAVAILVVVAVPVLILGTSPGDVTGATIAPTDTTIPPMSTTIPPPEAWDSILSTAVAGAAPTAATCPPGTDPNAPGPVDQPRPDPRWVGSLAAAFDLHSGRIVHVDATGATWTFDVCTNTWHQMHSTGWVPGELSGGLVYDVDSDVTVALGFESVSVYDANTNAWTRPASDGLGFDEANSITPIGGAYDPVTGLIITSNHKWTSETSLPYWEFWAYDVDKNEWTLIGPLPLEPDKRSQLDFLGYSESINRLIVAGWVAGDLGTVLVDPRTGEVTALAIYSPVVDIGYENQVYGPARGTVYVTMNTMDVGRKICGFNPSTLSWTSCFEVPDTVNEAEHRVYSAVVGDPINNRLVLIHGGWGRSIDDIWAIDFDTGEWIQLLAPSG